MAVKTSDLMKALLKNLDEVVTGREESLPATSDDATFVTWCRPGVAFDAEDLRFAASPEDAGGGADNDNASDELDQLKLQFEFSSLVNSIPKVNAIYDQDGSQLDKIYKDIITQSQVADNPISAEDLEKIKKYRDLLSPKEISFQDALGKTKTKSEPSAIMKAYDLGLADYQSALQEYVQLRTAAQRGIKGAAKEFASLGSILKKKVSNAYDKWVADGYKEEVDEMRAFIGQVTSRSLVTWKQGIAQNIKISELTDLTSNAGYLWTSFLPGNFAKRKEGWTAMSFGSSEYKSYENEEKDSWGASVDADFGLWSVSAKSSGTSIREDRNSNLNEYNISFGLTQVPILRPWFDPSFMKSRAWRLTPGGIQTIGSETVSTGGANPQGIIPAYTTSAIFIRDVELNLKSEDTSFKASSLVTDSSVAVGWGPIKVKGNYSNSRKNKQIQANVSGGSIKIPGMQLIGFKCAKLNYKAPNPFPDITKWS